MNKIKMPPMLILLQAILVSILLFFSLSKSNKAQMRSTDIGIKEMKMINTGARRIDKLFDSLELVGKKLDSINKVTRRKARLIRIQQTTISKQIDKIDTLARKD